MDLGHLRELGQVAGEGFGSQRASRRDDDDDDSAIFRRDKLHEVLRVRRRLELCSTFATNFQEGKRRLGLGRSP